MLPAVICVHVTNLFLLFPSLLAAATPVTFALLLGSVPPLFLFRWAPFQVRYPRFPLLLKLQAIVCFFHYAHRSYFTSDLLGPFLRLASFGVCFHRFAPRKNAVLFKVAAAPPRFCPFFCWVPPTSKRLIPPISFPPYCPASSINPKTLGTLAPLPPGVIIFAPGQRTAAFSPLASRDKPPLFHFQFFSGYRSLLNSTLFSLIVVFFVSDLFPFFQSYPLSRFPLVFPFSLALSFPRYFFPLRNVISFVERDELIGDV